MSFYTRFVDTEPMLTSTTTTVLGSTDVLFGYSFTDNKYHPVQVAQVGAGGNLQSLTSASTATNVTFSGITTFVTSNAIGYLLTAPPGGGYTKTLTTSSTAVVTITCCGASLTSSEALNGTAINLGTAGAAYGGYATFVSVGSTRWILTGRSTGLTIAS